MSLPDLKAAVIEAFDLAAAEIADLTARYDALLQAERLQHRQALADVTTALRAQLEESRRHVAYLTAELVARQAVAAPPRLTFGREVCRVCRSVFEKPTKRARVCDDCKARQRKANGRFLRPYRPGGGVPMVGDDPDPAPAPPSAP